MLTIRNVEPARAIPVFLGMLDDPSVTPAQWDSFCEELGLVALAAERYEDLAGVAVAESCPRRVHVRCLEGDAEACQFLLDRLVLLAGERDVSCRVPVERRDLRRMLLGLGFVRRGGGADSVLYYWDRNRNV
jgi:hypothetical protein